MIKTLSALMKSSFSPPKKHPEYESLADVVNHLESKYNLLEAIFSNLEDYMNRVNKEIDGDRVDKK